jgi:hypothetical protein
MDQRRIAGSRRRLILCVFAFAIGGSTALFCQESAGASSAIAPFGPGERITFSVEWNPPWYLFFIPSIQSGEAGLHVVEELEYQGRSALKIVFTARSSGAFAGMAGMKVDDVFEYITDAASLCTYKATRKIREGKRKRDIEVTYLPTGQLHIYDVDLAAVPSRIRKDEYKGNIPECVRDLFSALYWVRTAEFHAGAVQRSLVGNDDTIKEVESTVEKKEFVETPSGRFEAWRLNTRAILGGLFRDGGQFRFWLTADQRRIPVQFEAKVSLGKVTGKLKAMQPPAPAIQKPAAANTK